MEGIKKLVSIKASMNRGLPDKLKKAFPGLKIYIYIFSNLYSK
jgi:hypothetical protein